MVVLWSNYFRILCVVHFSLVRIGNGVSWIPASQTDSVSERHRGPILTEEPKRRFVFSNETGIEIRCTSDGRPRPIVYWTDKDGVRIVEVEGLRYVRHDGTLVLRPFRAEDFRQDIHSAVYRCAAFNSVGTVVSRDVLLRGVIRENAVPRVHESLSLRGNVAVLKCSVPTAMSDDVIVEAWFRDDGVIYNRNGEDSYILLQSGELLLYEVNPFLSMKRFGCKIKNLITGDVSSSSLSKAIVVKEPTGFSGPRLVFHRDVISAHAGSSVEMPCVVQSNPPPIYRWTKEENGRHQVSLKDNFRVWLRFGVMIIKNLRREDGGRYVCLAENSEGQLRIETNLIVTERLEPFIVPSRQIVETGSTVSINCTVRGFPVSSLIWLKNGKPVEMNSRVSTTSRTSLQLRNLKRDQQGMYQCLVANDHDSAQASMEISINDSPPEFVSVFAAKTANPRDPISLSCIVTGSPTPTLTWSLDGQDLLQTERLVIENFVTSRGHVTTYLNISHSRLEDSGLYRCNAVNEAASIVHAARVNIVGPVFVRPIKNVTAVSGDVVKIRCPYGGHPVQRVSWYKDGIILPVSSRSSVSEDGELTIVGIQRAADSGKYTCDVSSPDGRVASGTTYVTVHVAPQIDSHFFPDTITSEENARARLVCGISTGDPPVAFRWLKNGLPFTARKDVTLQTTEDSSLISFRRVAAEDSGLYTCIASNLAAANNKTAHLIVNVPPRWTVQPINVSVTLGQDLSLQCSARGYPSPTVTWKKAKGSTAGNFSFMFSSSRSQQFSDGTLLLRTVEESDGGFYLCQANNGIGSGLSVVIYVTVNVPPKISTKFRSMSKKKGEEAILVCEVIGDLPIVVTWQRSKELLDPVVSKRWGTSLSRPCVIHPIGAKCGSQPSRYTFTERSEERKIKAEFYIRELSKHDTGLYNCLANNSYGRDDAHYQLTVQDVPDPPYNFTVVNVSSSSFTIQWEVPFDGNSALKRYLLQYKKDDDSWAQRTLQEALPGTKSSLTIKALQPVTTYDVRFFSENAIGRSHPSDTIVVATEESVPSGPPVDINVQPTGSQSLKVTWKAPKKQHRHGKIQGYYVGYRMENGNEFQFKHVEGTDESERGSSRATYITNLRPSTNYAIVVQSYNSAGPGPISDERFGKTLESAPPTSPKLVATLMEDSSIKVHWERDPKDKSIVTDYTLHFRSENDDWQQKKLPADVYSHVYSGLRCGTRYWFYITAANSLGTGEASDAVLLRTKGAAPLSPQVDTFITPNATSATLNLSEWKSGGCPISHFSVKFKPKYYQQWKIVTQHLPASQNSFILTPLLPDREYIVHVTAHSQPGDTEAEYDVRTLAASLAMTSSPELSTKGTPTPFHRNLAVLIPILLSALVIILVVAIAAFCLWKSRRERDDTPTALNNLPRKEMVEDSVLMSNLEKKMASKVDLTAKEDYYSSPSKHATPITRKANGRDRHEYAEPYTALPPPRRVGPEFACREINNTQQQESNTRTFERRMCRPESRTSLVFQGPQDRSVLLPVDYCCSACLESPHHTHHSAVITRPHR